MRIDVSEMRIAILTLDSLYSNYALRHLIDILKTRVELVICTERINNKKYGSFYNQLIKIVKKSGIKFFIYLNLYVFVYRFLLYLSAFYRWLLRKPLKAFSFQQLSRHYGFKIAKTEDINSPHVERLLRKHRINLIVAIHLDQLIGKTILQLPKYGCINLHYGRLPENAGPFPTIWGILKNENEAYVTIHYMDEYFDQGDILDEGIVKIDHNESILSLDCRLMKLGSHLIRKVIKQLENGTQHVRPQDKGKFRYRSYPSKKKLKLLKRRKIALFRWHDFEKYFF